MSSQGLRRSNVNLRLRQATNKKGTFFEFLFLEGAFIFFIFFSMT
jgi:hypothetical protein